MKKHEEKMKYMMMFLICDDHEFMNIIYSLYESTSNNSCNS